MTKEEYFSQLVGLYEATNNVDATQAKIADSGSDVQGQAQQVDGQVQQSEGAPEEQQDAPQQEEELDDANYLQNDQTQENNFQALPDNNKKLLKLLELFKDLLTYTEMYYETVQTIDISTIEDETYSIATYRKTLLNLKEKIFDYLKDSFKNETYEKNLYVYIMLRTELLTAIKVFRRILKLDEESSEN